MAKKIVTNLRIDEADWLQVKAIAAEQNLSVNEYITQLIQQYTLRSELSLGPKSAKEKASIWDLPDLAKMENKPMGMSEEDRIIYGLDD